MDHFFFTSQVLEMALSGFDVSPVLLSTKFQQTLASLDDVEFHQHDMRYVQYFGEFVHDKICAC